MKCGKSINRGVEVLGAMLCADEAKKRLTKAVK